MTGKIRLIIVDDIAQTRESVQILLQFNQDIEVVGEARTGIEAVDMAELFKPDVMLMDINMPDLDGISATKRIVKISPNTQVIMMSVQDDTEYLRQAMLVGARDFLIKPFTLDDLLGTINSVYERRVIKEEKQAEFIADQFEQREAINNRKNSKVIAVYSPKGGTGCSLVAVNTAIALAERGNKTLLLDGSLQFGDVGLMLNMRAKTNIIDFLDSLDELDDDLFGSLLQKHSSGLNVILAPMRPEMAELITEEKFIRLLTMLKSKFDFIVMDTPSTLNPIALAILDQANFVILLVEQALPSIKGASAFLNLAQELDYPEEKIWLVVNRLSNDWSLSPDDISKALKRPVEYSIPYDPKIVRKSIDQGDPLVGGSNGKLAIVKALIGLSALFDQAEVGGESAKYQGESGAAEIQVDSVKKVAVEQKEKSFLSRIFGRFFNKE